MELRQNRRWVLASRPVGEPTDDCFELQERPVEELAAGEIAQRGRARADLWLCLGLQ